MVAFLATAKAFLKHGCSFRLCWACSPEDQVLHLACTSTKWVRVPHAPGRARLEQREIQETDAIPQGFQPFTILVGIQAKPHKMALCQRNDKEERRRENTETNLGKHQKGDCRQMSGISERRKSFVHSFNKYDFTCTTCTKVKGTLANTEINMPMRIQEMVCTPIRRGPYSL